MRNNILFLSLLISLYSWLSFADDSDDEQQSAAASTSAASTTSTSESTNVLANIPSATLEHALGFLSPTNMAALASTSRNLNEARVPWQNLTVSTLEEIELVAKKTKNNTLTHITINLNSIAEADGYLNAFRAAVRNLPTSITHIVIDYNGNSIDIEEASYIIYSLEHLNNLESIQILHSNTSFTILHAAAIQGNARIIELLLQSGEDINASDDFGDAALHHAVSNENIEATRLLIERGADIHQTENTGQTPLHQAAQNSQVEIIELLLQNGAGVNAVNDSGETSLYTSIFYDSTDIDTDVVDLLIRNGANINEPDGNNATLLHQAVHMGNLEAVEFLIQMGAQINAVDNEGRTPLILAKASNTYSRVRIVQLLEAAENGTINISELSSHEDAKSKKRKKDDDQDDDSSSSSTSSSAAATSSKKLKTKSASSKQQQTSSTSSNNCCSSSRCSAKKIQEKADYLINTVSTIALSLLHLSLADKIAENNRDF